MSQSQPLKKWHLVIFLLVILIAVIFKVYQSLWPKAVVKIAGQEIKVLVADTFKHRMEGWSDKNSMGKYGGMLFVFGDRGQHAVVMRAMRFPLDIIWIDGDKIVEIAPNIQPEPGKTEAELTPYFAGRPSTLVLELPAGFRERAGIKIGDIVEISK